MLWTDESTFYMVGYDRGSNPMMLMSKAKLNPESMTVEVSEILRAKEIRLAAQGLDGAVVYGVREDQTNVYAYDFAEDTVRTLFSVE